jgi:hypothetical protein
VGLKPTYLTKLHFNCTRNKNKYTIIRSDMQYCVLVQYFSNK